MWLVAVAVRWWHSYLLIDSIRWDLRIQEHREKISILKIAFSDTFDQAIFLYREEVAKLTSWQNSMWKYIFSNQGKSQRIISSFLYEFWWETGFTHKRTQEFQSNLFSIESMVLCPGFEPSYFITFSFHWKTYWYFCFHLHFFHFAAMVKIEGFWQLEKSKTSWKSPVALANLVVHIGKRSLISQFVEFECLNKVYTKQKCHQLHFFINGIKNSYGTINSNF